MILNREIGDRTFARGLVVICVLALALRMAVRLWLGTDGYWQSGYSFYAQLADNLRAGNGYGFAAGEPTAFRVPIYPLFIAAVTTVSQSPWLFAVAQGLVGCGTVACTAWLARSMFSAWAGLAAGAICAVYPYYLWHDLALQETGLFTFLATLATLLLIRVRAQGGLWRAGGAGFVLGCAILTRSTLAPFAPFAIAWLLIPGGATTGRSRLISAVTVLALCLATLGPWLVRTERVTGAYGLSTEFGRTLYIGNHALTFSAYPERSIDRSQAHIYAAMGPRERAALTELEHDEMATSVWLANEAMAAIVANPGRTFVGALRKLWAAFGPLPSPRHNLPRNLAYAAVWLALAAAGVAGAWQSRREWRRDSLFYAHFLTFAALSALLWAHTSHRVYLDVYLMVFAAGALRLIGRSNSLGP